MTKTKTKSMALPTTFSAEPDFNSELFTKLRIKVMHSGTNQNGSTFFSPAIEKAKPTLANIPLLAFVKKVDGTEIEDFDGHNVEVKWTEDGVEWVYLGRPIGVVPETNNYVYEFDEEAGRFYVYVDGYIWKEYANSALGILERDQTKSVSMEIRVNDWEETEDGEWSITDYSYMGIALLGDDVKPGMAGAKADVVSTFSLVEDELSKIMFQVKAEMEKQAVTEEQEEEKDDDLFEGSGTEPEVIPTEQDEDEIDYELAIESQLNHLEEENTVLANQIVELAAEKEALLAEQEAAKAEFAAKLEKLQTANTALLTQINTAVIAEFSDLEDVEEYTALAETVSTANTEELRTQLFALRGKHSVPKRTPIQSLVYSFIGMEGSEGSEPSWAELVRKNKDR